MWREMRIFAYKQAHNQVTENSKAEATFYPLWSVDSRGAGQLLNTRILELYATPLLTPVEG